MKILRRILNLRLHNRKRSSGIRERSGVQKISDSSERRKEWYAHVERMTEDQLVKIVNMCIPAGKIKK